ncbi:hypothetical protein FB45DRAFT_899494 [Roridomyces roridus]|uniref:CBM1 domain-containing protein n=1 Tax=Roridomyces roridus TaxID=1738132 RepID=A0AAD7C6Y3_9AGAR|nr:hypothetical protein FB45DRAFT_899494 [Roridomyces roridus]
MISLLSVAIVLAALPAAFAQVPIYGQCGGTGFSGQTTCVAGSVCLVQNPFYSQCVPGSATPPPSSTFTTPPVTSTASKTTSTGPASTPTSAVTYWFPFGDSYTTTGFLTNETLPSVGNPLGNPPFPGFTGGGGENYVGYDTVTYNASTILTYNYAYGGATINSSLVAPYLPTVLSLIDQVNEFLAGAGTKPSSAPWTSQNSLFSVWIGINDIGNSYYVSQNQSAFADLLLSEYFAQVQELYTAGARNFLFINVPPMDRSPLMIAEGTSATSLEAGIITSFNTKLAAKTAAFKASNSGVKTWTWDAWTEFSTILNSPTTYGFVDAVSFGNTGDFWGNNYHPGPAAHQIFASKIAALLANTPWF